VWINLKLLQFYGHIEDFSLQPQIQSCAQYILLMLVHIKRGVRVVSGLRHDVAVVVALALAELIIPRRRLCPKRTPTHKNGSPEPTFCNA